MIRCDSLPCRSWQGASSMAPLSRLLHQVPCNIYSNGGVRSYLEWVISKSSSFLFVAQIPQRSFESRFY